MQIHRPRIGSVGAGSSGAGLRSKAWLMPPRMHRIWVSMRDTGLAVASGDWQEQERREVQQQERQCRRTGAPMMQRARNSIWGWDEIRTECCEGGALSDVWGGWWNNACSRWICQWFPSRAQRLLLRGLAKRKFLGPTLWIWKPGVEPESLHFLTGFQWL